MSSTKTYGNMSDRIADELKRGDITTSQIQLAIKSAIDKYETRRWWFNETTGTLSTVASTNYVAVPTDFIEEDILQITVSGSRYELEKVNYRDIVDMDINSSTGQPSLYALYKDQIILYPTPNAIYTTTLHYMKTLTELVLASDSNEWMHDCEELIRSCAKKLIFINHIRNTQAANDMQAMEDAALVFLESMNHRKVSTGKLRVREL